MRNYLYPIRFFIAAAVAAAGLAGPGCTDNSGNGPGNPGVGGSSAGSAGATGTGGGSAGTTGTGGTSSGGTGGSGTPGFMSVLPCTSESQYVTTPTTVDFGLINAALAYDPKCLKVPAGTTVTFSGDFGMHPLYPSTHRGAQTGSPITITTTGTDGGTTKDFTFSTPGFYAYFCAEHDTSDTGNFMDGVVWVQ